MHILHNQKFSRLSWDSVMSCRRFLEGMRSRLTLVYAKLPHIYKPTCVKPFTETTQFSLYERLTPAYKLVCKIQKDAGLRFWTLGSAQPQRRCTSSQTHLPTRAATPQLSHRNCSVGQVLHAAHGQPPHLTHLPPYREVGLRRSQHQQPQVRRDLKPSKEVLWGFTVGPPNRGRESHLGLSKGKNGQWPNLEGKARRSNY